MNSEKYFDRFSRRFFIGDAFALFFASLFSIYAKFAFKYDLAEVQLGNKNYKYELVLFILSTLWVFVISTSNAYESGTLGRIQKSEAILITTSIKFVLFLAFSFYLTNIPFSRTVFVVYSILGLFGLVLNREINKLIITRNPKNIASITENYFIISSNESSIIQAKTQLAKRGDIHFSGQFLIKKNLNDLRDYALETSKNNPNSKFLILTPLGVNHSLEKVIDILDEFPMGIEVHPELVNQESYLNFLIRDPNSVFFKINFGKISGINAGSKRIFDILFSLGVLLVGLPIWTIIIFFQIIFQGFPVFYVSKRIGLHGKSFNFYKFRTMVINAEHLKSSERNALVDNEVLFKNPKDKRITKFGAFLRRTSLDEIPQFINVLKGEMSVVGPRPALAEEVEKYSRVASKRLKIKPGITGPWQVSGRSDLPWDKSISLDLHYALNWSFLTDILIIIRTISIIFTGKGAY